MITQLRHRIRDFFWAVRLRDFWVANGRIRDLEDRCARLESAVRELNPGLNI